MGWDGHGSGGGWDAVRKALAGGKGREQQGQCLGTSGVTLELVALGSPPCSWNGWKTLGSGGEGGAVEGRKWAGGEGTCALF